MDDRDYTVELVVDQAPDAVFQAINHVRGWWSGEITGDTDRLGAEFSYRVPGIHCSRQRITALVPGERIEWLVVESDLAHANPPTEWTGTRISFELARTGAKTRLRFTHAGLRPGRACFDSCSDAWATLLRGNLRALIATGEDQPNAFAR
jgi:hypothetical protein